MNEIMPLYNTLYDSEKIKFDPMKDVDVSEEHTGNTALTNESKSKSQYVNKERDLYLPCRVIRIQGEDEDERNKFSLSIAKATNSQKAIKNIDLKANAPEQVRFINEMRNAGIYYQTKRGETIPTDYKTDYKNTDLAEVGKLCLSGIFQRPGKSRSQPSILYKDQYYNVIFNGNQRAISGISRDLLYMDYYFR